MKTNVLHITISAVVAWLASYLIPLAAPLIALVILMALDYITGMIKAWKTSELSSKIGLRGIVKKVMYIVIIAVSMVIDYVIAICGDRLDIDIGISGCVAMMVIIWFIINEIISIMENAGAAGAPIPTVLTKIIAKLREAK